MAVLAAGCMQQSHSMFFPLHVDGGACFLYFMYSARVFCVTAGTRCYLKPIPNLPVSLLPYSQLLRWHGPCHPIGLVIRVLAHNLIIFNFAYPLSSPHLPHPIV